MIYRQMAFLSCGKIGEIKNENRKIMFVADFRINKERKKTILSKRLPSVKSLILINPLENKKDTP